MNRRITTTDFSLRSIFTTATFLVLATISFSQLDSIEVDIAFSTQPDAYDTTLTIDVMTVEITVDDISDVGQVFCDVTNIDEDYPIGKTTSTYSELSAAGQISSNTITLTYYYVDPSASYSVSALLRNSNGANLPAVTTNYNPL